MSLVRLFHRTHRQLAWRHRSPDGLVGSLRARTEQPVYTGFCRQQTNENEGEYRVGKSSNAAGNSFQTFYETSVSAFSLHF